MPQGRGLGRRISQQPIGRRLLSDQPSAVTVAERTLSLPTQYIDAYDQGSEGACTGFSASWMMSILNRRRYDARRLYLAAQLIDEWDDTPPAEGSSVHAACQVLLAQGHWRFFRGITKLLGLNEGIEAVRWATTVDELRGAVAAGLPFVLGINWYDEFFSPQYLRTTGVNNSGEWWIGRRPSWGPIVGGHAICAYAASDVRQAFRLVNTWGHDYPRPWIRYDAVQRLLDEDGEAALVKDRV